MVVAHHRCCGRRSVGVFDCWNDLGVLVGISALIRTARICFFISILSQIVLAVAVILGEHVEGWEFVLQVVLATLVMGLLIVILPSIGGERT